MNRLIRKAIGSGAALMLIAGLGASSLMPVASARSRPHDAAQADSVAYAALPREARHTVDLIRSGGPFPYARKDGTVFSNREGRLPRQARGYYHEYTVPTPGASTRGARRVIAGAGATGDARTSGEYWYTDDHYATFRRVVELPPSESSR